MYGSKMKKPAKAMKSVKKKAPKKKK